MALSSGSKLGPYEIVAPLGAGGMGEVYKAKDARLSRFVAIKVLPEPLAKSGDALSRFEREARAVGALNHPNILGIHDFATIDGTAFVVMELLEGESLRTRLDQGAFAPKRAVDLAIQMADGLAAAHEKGVVHRDLKPDNLWITKEGRLKILDFGLAKQVPVMAARSDSFAATEAAAARPTDAGTVMGTLGYMSPEQVRGETVDARSDLFSFGVVLYEMLTGRRAFQRASGSETMAAILRDDPPEMEGTGRPIPLALQRIVGHCLEKSPERRFHSARDVAFALQDLSSGVTSAPLTAPFAKTNRRATWTWRALAAALVLAAVAAGWSLRGGRGPLPTFKPLTHERGTVTGARFVPNSDEVIFSANWAGVPAQWYARRLDQAGTRPIAGSDGILLSLSPTGEGIGLSRLYLSHGVQVGALYTLPLAGGARREWISANVWGACPGSKTGEIAAVIGQFAAEIHLEWPLGRVAYKGLEVIRNPLVHDDLLAFVRERGNVIEEASLELLPRSGKGRTLAQFSGYTGMAWGPNGKELWISTYGNGESVLFAIDLQGRSRTLLRHAGRLEVQDVDGKGRVLAALHSYQRQTYARARGESKDRDLGWLDAQAALSMSWDGRSALLAPLAEWSAADGTLYVRPLTGEPAQTIGRGQRQSTISPDGKWVVSFIVEPTTSIVLMPVGPGTPRSIPMPDFVGDLRADLTPDDKTLIVWGRRKGEPFAFYAFDLDSGSLKKLTPPGSAHFANQRLLSPDGKWMAYVNSGRPAPNGENVIDATRVDGSEPHGVLTLPSSEAVAGWGPDSASLFVWDRNTVPADVFRVDVPSGKRTKVLTVSPADPVGVPGIQSIQLTTDAEAYVYNVTRKLSELYLIEGLK